MNENRNESMIVDSMVSNPNVSLINVRGAARLNNLEAFVPAVFAAVLAFFAGSGLAQWAAHERLISEGGRLASSIAMGFLMAWATYNGFYFLDRWMSASRYKANFDNVEQEREETPPDSFIETARQNERKRLTGRMRSLLKTLALHYNEINTLAVIPWYESKYLNRSQIEDVRAYMVYIGAALEVIRGGRSFVELSQWGRVQIPKWETDDFGDVIELTAVSPTPEGG